MAVDIQGIVGEQNMNYSSKEQVIAIISALPLPNATRRFLYARWARLVGVQAIPDDIDRVAPWG